MKGSSAWILLLALGCGSEAAPPPTTAAPATSVAAPPSTAAAAWAPSVAPFATATGLSCAIDAAPLPITEGDIAVATERPDDGEHAVLRLARRMDGAVRALRCERLPAGMELGDVRGASARTETVGGTALLFVEEEPGSSHTGGESHEFIPLWVFDAASLRLLGLIVGLADDGGVSVAGDEIHVGREVRRLVGGELVTLPSLPAEAREDDVEDGEPGE